MTDRDAVRDAIGPDDVVINCAAWTDVDGAEEHPDEALRVNATAPATSPRRPGARDLRVERLRLRRQRRTAPYIESDPRNPVSAYGRSKAAGERRHARGEPAQPRRAHLVALRRRRGQLRRHDAAPRRGARLGAGRRRPGRPADLHGPPRRGAARLRGERRLRHPPPQRPAASARWYELARFVFETAGVDCEVEPCTTAEFPRPAPRPAYSVLGSERGEARRCRDWQRGVDEYLAARGGPRMKLLVTGAAGFIGSTYVRLIEDDARRRRARQADLRRAAREPARRASSWWSARSRTARS